MFTVDLAEELSGTGAIVNAFHPATCMATKIVANPVSDLAEAVRATAFVVADPELDDVTGRYFHTVRDARADDQAYDPAARARLRDLWLLLTGLSRTSDAN